MLLEMSLAYAIGKDGAYGQYVDASKSFESFDLIKGEIPCRPIKGATGCFTNKDAVQRIDIQILPGVDKDIEGLKKGDFIKMKIDNGAIVREEEFNVSSVVILTYEEENHIAISLTPALKGIDGSDAKVVFGLHA